MATRVARLIGVERKMKKLTFRISLLLVILFITSDPKINNYNVNALQVKSKETSACSALKSSLKQLNAPKPKPKSVDRDEAFAEAKQKYSDLNFSNGNNLSFPERGRLLIGIWNDVKRKAVNNELKTIAQRNADNWTLKIKFNQTPRGPAKAKLSPKMIESDTQAMKDEVTVSKICGFYLSGSSIIDKK